MIKFDLPKGYYIRAVDDKNWAICRMLKIEDKESKNYGEEYEQIEGYWTSLNATWQAAVEVFALNADSNEELKAVLNQMESLKGALK